LRVFGFRNAKRKGVGGDFLVRTLAKASSFNGEPQEAAGKGV